MSAISDIVRRKMPDIEEDTLVIAVEEAETAVKNYCGFERIPKELRFVVANMARDILTESASSPSGDITEVTIDDVSVKTERRTGNDLIRSYKAQLDAFRRLRWSMK